MTYIIAEPCIDIKDKSCVDVCPVDCIHEFGRILVIDPEECIDCGACEPECPVEAIFPEDALPDKWEPFVKINYAFPDGATVIDALVDEYATEHNVQNEPLASRARAFACRSGPRQPRGPAPESAYRRAAEGGSRTMIEVPAAAVSLENVPLSSATRWARASRTASRRSSAAVVVDSELDSAVRARRS